MATSILFPLINPNEPEMLLALLAISNGQRVKQGDLLCVLETTKATQELFAETDGFIFNLTAKAGETVKAGDEFCVIASKPDWQPSSAVEKQEGGTVLEPSTSFPADIRITQPAFQLAQKLGIDVQSLPKGELITTDWLQSRYKDKLDDDIIPQIAITQTSILVFGGGGHGKSLIELLRMEGRYTVVGIVDDNKPLGSTILEIPVIGNSRHLPLLYQRGLRLAVNAVGGIGNIGARIAVFDQLLSAGFTCPSLIHPTSFVEPSATLQEGTQVFPHAYVGSESRIGFGVIINTGAIVSHDCVLGDYVNLSPGAVLAGEVFVGEKTLIGMGVTVNLRVKIGSHCRIGNGATIKQDVPDNAVIRAGSVWPPA